MAGVKLGHINMYGNMVFQMILARHIKQKIMSVMKKIYVIIVMIKTGVSVLILIKIIKFLNMEQLKVIII